MSESSPLFDRMRGIANQLDPTLRASLRAAIDAAEAAYLGLKDSQAEQVKIIKSGVKVNQELWLEISQLRARVAELEAERDNHRRVLEKMIEPVWDGCDVDGGDFQDALESAGILVVVPASEEIRAEYDCEEMFQFAWKVA